MKIGISGTMGAGKSSVSSYIASLGYPVYDADKMVHDLYETQAIRDFLLLEFGRDVVNEEGVNRKALARRVFSDYQALSSLEAKIYPMVRSVIASLDEPLVFVEVPLLFEAGFESLFDIIVVVVAKHEVRFERLKKRGMSMDDIIAREGRQMSQSDKIKNADIVIDNSFGFDALYKSVDAFLERIVDE